MRIIKCDVCGVEIDDYPTLSVTHRVGKCATKVTVKKIMILTASSYDENIILDTCEECMTKILNSADIKVERD